MYGRLLIAGMPKGPCSIAECSELRMHVCVAESIDISWWSWCPRNVLLLDVMNTFGDATRRYMWIGATLAAFIHNMFLAILFRNIMGEWIFGCPAMSHHSAASCWWRWLFDENPWLTMFYMVFWLDVSGPSWWFLLILVWTAYVGISACLGAAIGFRCGRKDRRIRGSVGRPHAR